MERRRTMSFEFGSGKAGSLSSGGWKQLLGRRWPKLQRTRKDSQSSWESVRRLWLVSEGKRKEKSYRLLRNSEKWEDLLAEVLWEAVRGREDFFVLRF